VTWAAALRVVLAAPQAQGFQQVDAGYSLLHLGLQAQLAWAEQTDQHSLPHIVWAVTRAQIFQQVAVGYCLVSLGPQVWLPWAE